VIRSWAGPRLSEPRNLAELAAARRDLPGAVLVAGGTIAVPGWRACPDPGSLISLAHVDELRGQAPRRIGAAVTVAALADDDSVPGALRHVAAGIGTPAVRGMATVGGNVVGAAPGCLAVVLLALDTRAGTLGDDGAVRDRHVSDHVGRPGPVLVDLGWRETRRAVAKRAPVATLGPAVVTVAAGWDAEDGFSAHAVAAFGGAEMTPACVPLGPALLRRHDDPAALSDLARCVPPDRRRLAALLLRRCLDEMKDGRWE
jgi:CO/xanthine dehydrogenase FAD-binding subunit